MTSLEAPVHGAVEVRARAPWTRWRASAWWVQHAALLGALATVLVRLPGLGRAPGLDEAGFLVVARQWSPGGSSLYGNYWVDRPPLLISIFRVAALHGGLETLRLIGALAAAATVLGVAHATRTVAARSGTDPHRAAAWATAAATAWLVSPLTGSAEVNGELLAAPLVAWGIAAAMASLDPGVSRAVGRAQAAAAGACAAAGLLVKQNFADVAVFATIALFVSLLRAETTRVAAGRLVARFLAGAAGTLALVGTWTLMHGTSLAGVLWAMYPFRLLAGQVIAGSGNAAVPERLGQLGQAWMLSGLGVVTLAVAGPVLRRVLRAPTAVLALLGLVVFDGVSIVLGGNFWLHYLVQMVVPLAILVGVVGRPAGTWARRLVVPVVVSAVAAAVLAGSWAPSADRSQGALLGRAVAAASRPGDTIVTLYGHSDVTQQSGLASPYPYLWSLPLKTLDPDLSELTRVLEGPDAPTWLVTWGRLTTWGVRSDGAEPIVARDYHVAAVIQGHTVYVRNDVERAVPQAAPATH